MSSPPACCPTLTSSAFWDHAPRSRRSLRFQHPRPIPLPRGLKKSDQTDHRSLQTNLLSPLTKWSLEPPRWQWGEELNMSRVSWKAQSQSWRIPPTWGPLHIDRSHQRSQRGWPKCRHRLAPIPHPTAEGRLELLLTLLRLRGNSCLLGATFPRHPQLFAGRGGGRGRTSFNRFKFLAGLRN